MGPIDGPSPLSLDALEIGEPGPLPWLDTYFSSANVAPAPTSPHLVRQSERTAVYRRHNQGFKVVRNPQPTEEEVLRIFREQQISDFLPPSCRKRRVIDVTSFERRTALHFEWEEGSTLWEWLETAGADPCTDLSVRLRVATAVARTLADFHGAGVAYNSLASRDIVLAPFEATGGECVATFIDLSRALVYREGDVAKFDAATEKRMIEVDLRYLGMVLDQIFRAEGSAVQKEAEQGLQDALGDAKYSRQKRGKLHALGDGLPLYLGTLISALLDTSGRSGTCYQNVRDVYLDLKVLAEDSHGRLSETRTDEARLRSRLHLGGAFYGRQVQMSMLLHLFQTTVLLGSEPQMATIRGYPGAGYV